MIKISVCYSEESSSFSEGRNLYLLRRLRRGVSGRRPHKYGEPGCGSPPAPSHGSVTLNSPFTTIAGSTATQSCNQGYQMTGGDGNIWCHGSGTWRRTITCLKDCGSAPKPTYGTVLLTNVGLTSYGATATQSCNAGYKIKTGTGTITCLSTGKWSTSITCQIKDCGSAPKPTYGTVRLTNAGQTFFKSTATQSCNAGYEMVTGTGTIKCLSTGKWSTSITCQIKDCGSAPKPTYGTVQLTKAGQTFFKSTASQSCNTGYEMVSGTGTIKCVSTGKWSSSITCQIKDCGSAPQPTHGTVRLTQAGQTFFKSTATQSCNAGYEMVTGTGTIKCLSTGKWSTSITCQIKDCGNAAKPVYGTVQLTKAGQTFFESTATQSCNTGYEMVTGTGTVKCLSNGKWSSSITCQLKDCGSAPKPAYGTVQLTKAGQTFFESTAIQSCNAGYEMVTGSGTIKCLSNGKWSSSITCQIKDCGSAPKPAYGTVQLTKAGQTFFESTAIQSCNAGYEKVTGTSTIKCLSNGKWSSSITCQIKDCGSAPKPAYGTVQLTKAGQTFFESTAIQACNAGYETVTGTGTGTIQCLSNGKWSSSITCQIKDCGSAPKPAYGTVQLTKAGQTFFESTAIQSCNTGYEMVTGTGTIKCLSNGKWSSSITCQIKDCGSAPKPTNGTVRITEAGQTFYRSTALQSCNTGYKMLTGTGTIECLSNGKWSSSITCLIDCGSAPKPTHGTVQLSMSGQTYSGSTAFQTCDTGYKMVAGTSTITCKASGDWSSSITCLIDCDQPPEPTYGTVQLANTDHTFQGSTALQYCDIGYEMVNDTNTIFCQEGGNWSTSIVCFSETVPTSMMTKTSMKQHISTVQSVISLSTSITRTIKSQTLAKRTTLRTRNTDLIHNNTSIPTISTRPVTNILPNTGLPKTTTAPTSRTVPVIATLLVTRLFPILTRNKTKSIASSRITSMPSSISVQTDTAVGSQLSSIFIESAKTEINTSPTTSVGTTSTSTSATYKSSTTFTMPSTKTVPSKLPKYIITLKTNIGKTFESLVSGSMKIKTTVVPTTYKLPASIILPKTTTIQTVFDSPANATLPVAASVLAYPFTHMKPTVKTTSALTRGAKQSTTVPITHTLATNVTLSTSINQSITTGEPLQDSLQCLDLVCGEVGFLNNPSFIGGLSSAFGVVTLIPLIACMYKSFAEKNKVIPENGG